MAKSPHLLNTWDYVEYLLGDIESDSDEHFSTFNRLKRHWDSIPKQGHYIIEDGKNILVRERGQAKNPLEAFIANVYEGVIPPPELLLFMADCFTYYLQQNGNAELEHIFHGREKSGVGNYSARLASKNRYYLFELAKHFHEENSGDGSEEQPSLSKLAENFINENQSTNDIAKEPARLKNIDFDNMDVESFLRGYRRHKRKKTDN